MLAGDFPGTRKAKAHYGAQGAHVFCVSTPDTGLSQLDKAGLLIICDAAPERFHSLREAARTQGYRSSHARLPSTAARSP